MRTTLNIHDDLLAEAKVRAARDRRSIGDVVDEALRDYFSRESVTSTQVVLPDFHYSGGISIDLYDKDALDDVLSDRAHS